MPTIDGGHIFLTLLAPVRLGEVAHPGGYVTTYSHLLREELAMLPTAAQSPVSIETGLRSPFSRCTRTHFLRMFVVDQPMFNGRDPADPLVNAAMRVDPLLHQRFDVLSRPWLVLSADIDRRAGEPDDGIASWAEGLWVKSEAEMRALFGHCFGFENVQSAAAFAAYVKRCQIDTVMSFNDYWQGRPPLKGLTLKGLAVRALAPALLAAGVLWLLGAGWWSVIGAVAGLALGIGLVIWQLWTMGKKPFPAAPDSDLPSVLKSLHVQQRFAVFAESVQGMEAQALHRSFGQFLADVRPDDVAAPTQVPGVIRSDGVELVEHKAVTPKRAVL